MNYAERLEHELWDRDVKAEGLSLILIYLVSLPLAIVIAGLKVWAAIWVAAWRNE